MKGRKDASIKAHAGLHEPPLPEAVFRKVSIDSGSCSMMCWRWAGIRSSNVVVLSLWYATVDAKGVVDGSKGAEFGGCRCLQGRGVGEHRCPPSARTRTVGSPCSPFPTR